MVSALEKERLPDFLNFFIYSNYYSPRDPLPSSLRKILANAQRETSLSATPVVGSSPVLQQKADVNHITTSRSPADSPLTALNTTTSNKRKKNRESMSSSIAKKRKEDIENVEELVPRRKLLFQPHTKPLSLYPANPLTAVTPDGSPKTKKNHPCFSQATTTSTQPTTEKKVRVRLLSGGSSPVKKDLPGHTPRRCRESWADFRLSSPKKRAEPRIKTSTLVCTSLRSE